MWGLPFLVHLPSEQVALLLSDTTALPETTHPPLLSHILPQHLTWPCGTGQAQ